MHSIIYNSIIYNRALTPPFHTHTHICVDTHTYVCVLGLLFWFFFLFFFKKKKKERCFRVAGRLPSLSFFLRKRGKKKKRVACSKTKKVQKKGEGPTPPSGEALNQAKRGGELRDKQ